MQCSTIFQKLVIQNTIYVVNATKHNNVYTMQGKIQTKTTKQGKIILNEVKTRQQILKCAGAYVRKHYQ